MSPRTATKTSTATKASAKASTAAAATTAPTPADPTLASSTLAHPTPAKPTRSRTSRAARAARLAPPVALGSLTQAGARSGTRCRTCHSDRVTTLTLVLTDGTPVEFTSCHACENRTWFSAEGELDRATVLERTRKIR